MPHFMIALKKHLIFKKLTKVLISLCFIFLVERCIRLQTHGFRLEKVYFDQYVFSQEETKEQFLENPLFKQTFTFIGSGVQCYVFLGEDKKTVLKLFKHYHAWPSSTLLKKLPLPHFLYSWKEKILQKRKNRIKALYKSVFLAKELSENTGVLHIHLQPTQGKYPQILIFDKIGILHHLSLDKAAFALQKRAQPLGEYLEKYPEKRRQIVNSFLECILYRYQKSIANADPVFFRNFGVYEEKVVEIDIGSFSKNLYLNDPKIQRKELFYETLPLKSWLKKNAEKDLLFFEEQIYKVLL